MKLSYGIFLIGAMLSVILVFLIHLDSENPGNVIVGLVSEDAFDKIITLYFIIVVIKFFFGGLIYYFESGMKTAERIPLSEAEFDLEENDLDEKYIEYVKTRYTRSNPLM